MEFGEDKRYWTGWFVDLRCVVWVARCAGDAVFFIVGWIWNQLLGTKELWWLSLLVDLIKNYHLFALVYGEIMILTLTSPVYMPISVSQPNRFGNEEPLSIAIDNFEYFSLLDTSWKSLISSGTFRYELKMFWNSEFCCNRKPRLYVGAKHPWKFRKTCTETLDKDIPANMVVSHRHVEPHGIYTIDSTWSPLQCIDSILPLYTIRCLLLGNVHLCQYRTPSRNIVNNNNIRT